MYVCMYVRYEPTSFWLNPLVIRDGRGTGGNGKYYARNGISASTDHLEYGTV